jgi:hypothetical protein
MQRGSHSPTIADDAVTFWIPRDIAGGVLDMLCETPMEHPRRPGVMSRLAVRLSVPARLNFVPVKVWFPVEKT